MDQPAVSVLITTFNQAEYLSQAVESALMQETTFPVEILIGDDGSTDGTGTIAGQFSERHPDRVRFFSAPKNEGGHANFSRLYRNAQGRYVALLEGDDYWTNPAKLQRQVDFLESEHDFAICAHRLEIRYEDGSDRPSEITNTTDPPVSNLERLTRFNFIWTASCVFRNGLIDGVPDWVFPLPLGDWPLFVQLAEHGKIRILEEVMGVYRIHCAGFWGRRPEQARLIATVRVAEVMKEHLGHPGFDDCIFKTSRTIAKKAWRNGNRRRAIRYFAKCARVVLSRPSYGYGTYRKERKKRKKEKS